MNIRLLVVILLFVIVFVAALVLFDVDILSLFTQVESGPPLPSSGGISG